MYFNLSGSKLAGKHIKSDQEKINPNLLKIFLRHFPNFAKERDLNFDSEPEDYENQAPKKNSEDNIATNSPYKKPVAKKSGNAIKTTTPHEVQKDVFVTDMNEEEGRAADLQERNINTKNVYEFPDLNKRPDDCLPRKPEEPKDSFVKQSIKNKGWNQSDLHLTYTNQKMDEKVLAQEFPDLLGLGGGSGGGGMNDLGSTPS